MSNKHSFWKHAFLWTVSVLGLVYAAPNLFPDQPIIQISLLPDGNQNLVELDTEVKRFLKQEKLKTLGSRVENQSLLISFRDTDTQLRAKDNLSVALGDRYAVSANLMPVLPAWLRNIGASPMNLGLDLRGGVHFVLELDINNLLSKRLGNLIRQLGDCLREQGFRYLSIKLIKAQDLSIEFQSRASLEQAVPLLKRVFPSLGFYASTSSACQLLIEEKNTNVLQEVAVNQTIETLRNRLNSLGISEPIIQKQGKNRISIDLPGMQDVGRARQILGDTATIEFHLFDTTVATKALNTGFRVPSASRLYTYQSQPILLKKQVILSGASIIDAVQSFDEIGHPTVDISLGGGGENQFYRITRENIGKFLAVVHTETRLLSELVNKQMKQVPHQIERVISIAKINSPLFNYFQIKGLNDLKEAQNLALLLRSGALPAPIYVVEQRTVGPTLGADNIRMGLFSIVFGLILAIVFMAFYYSILGLIADFALVINLVLLVALLSLLGMTLTLPGMAGIVLTLGIAVDANVLIFERIREERRNGTSVLSSIWIGYDRAFVTILDANATTLITAIVLFYIGSGSIRGFAVTLMVGVLTSLLTGVGFTRVMIETLYGKRGIKRLPIGI